MREIDNPLGVIDDLFAAHAKGFASSPESLPAREWHEKAHFIQALQLHDEENFSKIPLLNEVGLVEKLPPFSLVRYRCLVQDVFEPELFATFLLERSSDGQEQRLLTLKYREVCSAQEGKELHDLGRPALGMRGAYYCVPLPGETSWARPTSQQVPGAQPTTSSSGTKRTRPDEDVDMAMPDHDAVSTSASIRAKLGQARPTSQEVAKNSDTFGLNFPLPWEERKGSSIACIVKLYDADQEALKVCETVEVLGILCVDPAMANLGAAPSQSLFSDARNPSTALVPRLHGLLVRKLPFYHPMFPFTPQWLSEERLACAFQRRLAAPGAVEAARGAAISLLQRVLGDELAAEYVLALLASRVYEGPGGMPLGQWSLNITGSDSNQVSHIFNAIEGLVPRAVCLPVTADALNGSRWSPRKDFDANRLVAGKLQLSAGTLLLLDETQLQEGKLHEDGVKAVQAIQSLVSERALLCDFNHCTVRLPVEVTCLVASTGASVLKATDVVLPLCRQARAADQDLASSLDASRFLLGMVTRQTRPVQMPEQVATALSTDYAQMRESFQEVGQSLLHGWMSLARAVCFTHGEDELSLPRWRSVVEMERRRIQRCVDAGLMQRR